MNQTILDALQRCYAQSREPVLLLDEAWQVVWQNMPPEVGYLPELLGIPEDSWTPCERTVEIAGCIYTLRMLCNPEDGIRIVTLNPGPLQTIPMETEPLSEAVHSICVSCSTLHQIFDEYELYDNTDILRSLAGNCLRIYRPVFLQREMERCKAGFWVPERYSARQLLIDIHQQIKRVLGRCANVQLEVCTGPACICCDADAFISAVLCALATCYHEPEHRLDVMLRLTREGTNCAVTVSITPTPEERDDAGRDGLNFGSTFAEQTLLDLFSREYGGSWMQGSTGDTHFCRITLPCEDEEADHFHSSRLQSESGFFSKYQVLLARIRHYELP